MNQSTFADLIQPLMPLSPDDRLSWVAEHFSSPEYETSLSIPVVENDIPIGVISRFALNRLFLPRFGHALYGKKTVASVMNRNFIRVQSNAGLDEAAAQVAREMQWPLSEDFVVCRDEKYIGVGMVMSLLEATGQRLASNTAELQKAYDNLKQSQQRLVQSEKMSSLGQMVAGLAHEMNTPLAYIRNNLMLLEEFSAVLAQDAEHLPQQSQQLLSDVVELSRDALFGVEQIDDLVKGLKAFSRDDQGQKIDVDINDCIRRALTLARNAIPETIKVHLVLGEVSLVTAAASQLNQVLINLLVNGAQAITEQTGSLIIKSWQAGARVLISVQDSGKGIAPADIGRIFDPFFTTKEVGEGTGLGLSICYDIVQKHGGDIRVVSKPGVGTRFLIILPAKQNNLVSQAQASALSRTEQESS